MVYPRSERHVLSNGDYGLAEGDTHANLYQSAGQWAVIRGTDHHHVASSHIVMVMLPKYAAVRGTVMRPAWLAVVRYMQEWPARDDIDFRPLVT
jgi:hypothetical protein